jgi:hypothetical protein
MGQIVDKLDDKVWPTPTSSSRPVRREMKVLLPAPVIPMRMTNPAVSLDMH